MSKCIDLFFNFIFLDSEGVHQTRAAMKQTEHYSPIILQLQLQLKALNLHLPFSVVFQDLCIWLTVFWGSDIPGIGPILRTLLRPKGRQVPDDVTVCAAVQRIKNRYEATENLTLTFRVGL